MTYKCNKSNSSSYWKYCEVLKNPDRYWYFDSTDVFQETEDGSGKRQIHYSTPPVFYEPMEHEQIKLLLNEYHDEGL
jgi:hypothetical protein